MFNYCISGQKTWYITLFLCLLAFSSLAQGNKSAQYFEKGNKAYQEEDYQQALKYYTLAIEEEPTEKAYFNRGLTYFRLKDSCNYCKDFFLASSEGDKKSKKIYEKNCFILDTLYNTEDSIKEEFPGYSYTLVSVPVCSSDTTVRYYDARNQEIVSLFLTQPEYPGGTQAMLSLLSANLNYPLAAREGGIHGIVYISFIVEKSGKVSSIKVLRGIGGGCDEEAMRIIGLMPHWKPGTRKGIPVRVQFKIPIKFTLS